MTGTWRTTRGAGPGRPGRALSCRLFWAPAGRFRGRVPADTPLLAAKRYYFNLSRAYHPMVVWVGRWNCRTFPADPAEYFFVERGSGRYAVPHGTLSRRHDPPGPSRIPRSFGAPQGAPGLGTSSFYPEPIMSRSTATVKWYDHQQGHGFLMPEGRGPDVFVHHSALHGSGLKALGPGERVEYDEVETEFGPAAEGVVRLR